MNKTIKLILAIFYPLIWVTLRFILIIIFYGVFMPLAFIIRIAGKDPLYRKLDSSSHSYYQASKQKPNNHMDNTY